MVFVGMDSMGSALLDTPSGWGTIVGVFSALLLLIDRDALKRHRSRTMAIR